MLANRVYYVAKCGFGTFIERANVVRMNELSIAPYSPMLLYAACGDLHLAVSKPSVQIDASDLLIPIRGHLLPEPLARCRCSGLDNDSSAVGSDEQRPTLSLRVR
jgi:hypothetical protein